MLAVIGLGTGMYDSVFHEEQAGLSISIKINALLGAIVLRLWSFASSLLHEGGWASERERVLNALYLNPTAHHNPPPFTDDHNQYGTQPPSPLAIDYFAPPPSLCCFPLPVCAKEREQNSHS